MMVVGVNLLVGGLIVTVITVGEPFLNPFNISSTVSYSPVLGLILTVAGFSVIAAGFILVINYDRNRTWHLNEVQKAAMLKNRRISVKSAHEMMNQFVEEEKTE